MTARETHGWSATTEEIMTRIGWHPSRRIPETTLSRWEAALQRDGFRMFPAARDVLLEFGELRWDRPPSMKGVDHAPLPFEFDPMVAFGEHDRISDLEESSQLYPVGEVEHGHAFLVVDEGGSIYLAMDDLMKIGSDIHDAIEAMIRGKRWRP